MRNPRRALAALARSGGGVVELGPGTWLVTDPATTERLLASRHALTDRTANDSTANDSTATDWGADGLERWMAARRAMRPELSAPAVARFTPVVGAYAGNAVSRWTSAASIDAMAEAARLISAVNTHHLLGEPAPLLADLAEQELSVAERVRPLLPRRRRLWRAQLATHTALGAHLRAHPPTAGPVAALTGAGLDEPTTALAARTMLLAGHHVPAAALAWALHELSLRDDLQQRLRDEAAAHPDPSTADLPLCRAVVHETLRLHPPIWQLRRVLDAPVLGFPAGAELLFSPYANHRDPVAHPDPERFDPDRFGLDRAPHRSSGSYLPFALGPRFCPGSHLATAELAVVLATVLGGHRVVPHRAPAPSRGVLNAPRRLRLSFVRHHRW